MPDMLFLLTSGTIRNLTRLAISPVSRLAGSKKHAVGTILKGKTNDESCLIQDSVFCIKPLFFIYLSPFSYPRKKKDQKESRPSAGGRFFREPPQRHECNSVACDSLTWAKTSARNGSTRKNPPYPRSLQRKNLLLRETWPCSLFPSGERAGERGLSLKLALDCRTRCHTRTLPEQGALFHPAPNYGILQGWQANGSGESCEGIRAMHMAGSAPSGDFWFLLVASKGTRRRQGF